MSVVVSASKWLSSVLTSVVHNFDSHQGFWLVSLTFVLVFIGYATCIVAARNDRRRTRPYVILEALPEMFLGLRLSNVGLTMAKNVKISSTPPIRLVFPKYKQDIRFISRGVACLPPRAFHKTSLGLFEDLRKDNPELVFKGDISYEDDAGHKYSEKFVLDYSLFEDVTLFSDDNDTASRIRELTREFHDFATGFHRPHIVVDKNKLCWPLTPSPKMPPNPLPPVVENGPNVTQPNL